MCPALPVNALDTEAQGGEVASKVKNENDISEVNTTVRTGQTRRRRETRISVHAAEPHDRHASLGF